MNIRNRLLYLLLPPLIAFAALTMLFFYYQWRQEILETFKARLEAVVETTVQGLQQKKIQWLLARYSDKEALSDPVYKQLKQQLREIARTTAIDSLFIVKVEAVSPGEPVLLDQHHSEENPLNEGQKALAFRQVYLLDVTPTKEHERTPNSYDFSESDEHLIYLSKQPLITPVYTARLHPERLISAYAPILDEKNNVLALVGADVSMSSVDKKLQNALVSLVISACAIVILVSLSVLAAANKISKPVQRLKEGALNIAAGEYDTTVEVKEPLEIAELAHTMNTMSACLKEQFQRLEQSAATRERLFGEYECALLLQKKMFLGVCETFSHPHLQLQGLCTSSASQPHGVYVELSCLDLLRIDFLEDPRFGFESLFSLLKEPLSAPTSFNLVLDWEKGLLRYSFRDHFPPLLWSANKLTPLDDNESEVALPDGAIVILTGLGAMPVFKTVRELSLWLERPLKHFASEDFTLLTEMLHKELSLLCQRSYLEWDLFFLVVRINSSGTKMDWNGP